MSDKKIYKCPYIFKKGKNKNKVCEKNTCSRHYHLVPKQGAKELFDLPDELHRIIVSYIGDFSILKNLSETCKDFHRICEPYFKIMYYNQFTNDPNKNVDINNETQTK